RGGSGTATGTGMTNASSGTATSASPNPNADRTSVARKTIPATARAVGSAASMHGPERHPSYDGAGGSDPPRTRKAGGPGQFSAGCHGQLVCPCSPHGQTSCPWHPRTSPTTSADCSASPVGGDLVE